MNNSVISEVSKKMDKAIEAFERDLKHVRTGRASAALLDGVTVDYYGSQMPLNQVASIAVSDSSTITVQPWDANILADLEKAILASDLGLTPSNDGKLIRISVPPLTEERRKELVKLVKKMAEDCRVAIRNCRRDAMDKLKKQKKDKEISEDDMHRLQDEVQKVTDRHIEQVEEVLKKKEKEIMDF